VQSKAAPNTLCESGGIVIPIGTGRDSRRGRGKQFFFEKKNQKTFETWRACRGNAYAIQTKVFASFFKKKRFPTLYGSISMRLSASTVLRSIGLGDNSPAKSVQLIVK
jgi:hypothetical protein